MIDIFYEFIQKYGLRVLAVSVICLSLFLARPKPATIIYPEKEIIREVVTLPPVEVIREIIVYKALNEEVDDDVTEIWATTSDSVEIIYDHSYATTGSSLYWNPRGYR